MKIKDVAKLANVSVRTLQYYDKIGLLSPKRTSSSYRIYEKDDIEKLQQIMFFKELDFPLSDIKNMIEDENFDRDRALEDQIKILTMKRDRIDRIIDHAKNLRYGDENMKFDIFDDKEIKKYEKEAKERWKNTKEFKEFEKKRVKMDIKDVNKKMMDIFLEFNKIMDKEPGNSEVLNLVEKLKNFIDKNFYSCSNEMLLSLGLMYSEDERFKKNIDSYAGEGTAEFVTEAIKSYVK